MSVMSAAGAHPVVKVTDQPAPANARGHIAALDGVRGLAILLVMLYHFEISLTLISGGVPWLRPLQFGWCGVCIFFTLSGFLITGILLDTRLSSHYFKSFYARRALRILPLYYVGIAVVFLLHTALLAAGIRGAHGSFWSPASLVWPSLYLENFALLKGGGTAGILSHYWSLAVEEHFYLVWPLLIWVAKTKRQVLTLAVAASVLSILGRIALSLRGTNISRVFALTPLQLDGLAIGAVAAVLVRSGSLDQLIRWARATLPVPLGLLIALILVRHSLEQTDPGLWIFSYPLISLCTAQLLILSLTPGRIASVLSVPVLRWLGKYSFGLYVWHPIIGTILFHSRFRLVSADTSKPKLLLAALFIACLDLLVAWLSFHLLEKRFLALKRYFLPVPPAAAPRAAVMDQALSNATL